jgi:hypothetical protein
MGVQCRRIGTRLSSCGGESMNERAAPNAQRVYDACGDAPRAAAPIDDNLERFASLAMYGSLGRVRRASPLADSLRHPRRVASRTFNRSPCDYTIPCCRSTSSRMDSTCGVIRDARSACNLLLFSLSAEAMKASLDHAAEATFRGSSDMTKETESRRPTRIWALDMGKTTPLT